MKIKYSPIAQSVERVTVNHDVVGSSPTWGAKKRKTGFILSFFFFVFTNWTRKAESENNLNGCFPAVARQGESNCCGLMKYLELQSITVVLSRWSPRRRNTATTKDRLENSPVDFFGGGETVGPNGGTRLQRKCAWPFTTSPT